VTVDTTQRDQGDARIILITGNMAAGKSTVAQALAEQFPRSVHLRGDLFRRMIVRGAAPMDFALSPEAERQLRLRYALAAAAARRYYEAGFTVVYQDIIIGPALAEAARALHDLPLTIIVLCPDPAAIAAREAARPKQGYTDAGAILAFDHALREETPRLGHWLDTTTLTVAETVDQILALLL
jgi:predicted kinase